MQETQFPLYREYRESIRQANDAVAALLVGSRLSAHTLQLNTGSRHPLSELFPQVEHIRRLNLQTGKAQAILRNADHHLASITIPYVLAIHEDFIKSVFNGLSIYTSSKTLQKTPRAFEIHEEFFSLTQYSPPHTWLLSFHTLRTIRNTIIHGGNIIDKGVIDAVNAMDDAATTGWHHITGEPPHMLLRSNEIQLKAEHIFVTFAVIKQLGREINQAYTSFLDRSKIALECVNDFNNINRSSKSPKSNNSSAWRRSLLVHAKFNYRHQGFTETELLNAAQELGFWTITMK